MAKLVSKVYGDALFEAALEENQLDAVWDEVREIASILQENEAFIDIMNHPEMTREKRTCDDGRSIWRKSFGCYDGLLQVLVKKKDALVKLNPCWNILTKEQKNIRRLALSM